MLVALSEILEDVPNVVENYNSALMRAELRRPLFHFDRTFNVLSLVLTKS